MARQGKDLPTSLYNTATGYICEGVDLKGGYAVVADITNITEIPATNIEVGSMVYNKADNKLYTYTGTNWTELVSGASEGDITALKNIVGPGFTVDSLLATFGTAGNYKQYLDWIKFDSATSVGYQDNGTDNTQFKDKTSIEIPVTTNGYLEIKGYPSYYSYDITVNGVTKRILHTDGLPSDIYTTDKATSSQTIIIKFDGGDDYLQQITVHNYTGKTLTDKITTITDAIDIDTTRDRVTIVADGTDSSGAAIQTVFAVRPEKVDVTGRLTVSKNIEVGGNLVPKSSSNSALGTATKQWNNLHLNQGIYMGAQEDQVLVIDAQRDVQLRSNNELILDATGDLSLSSSTEDVKILSGVSGRTWTSYCTDDYNIIALNADDNILLGSYYFSGENNIPHGSGLKVKAASSGAGITLISTEQVKIIPSVDTDEFQPLDFDVPNNTAHLKMCGQEIVLPGAFNWNDGEDRTDDILFCAHGTDWAINKCAQFAITTTGNIFCNGTNTPGGGEIVCSDLDIRLQSCNLMIGADTDSPTEYTEEEWTFYLEDGNSVTKKVLAGTK